MIRTSLGEVVNGFVSAARNLAPDSSPEQRQVLSIQTLLFRNRLAPILRNSVVFRYFMHPHGAGMKSS